MTNAQRLSESSPEVAAEARTYSGLPVKDSYTPADIRHIDYDTDIGDVGAYPFTRGIHPGGYRTKSWTQRLQAGYGSPADTNERWRYYLKEGLTGLNIELDIASHMGLDADHPRVVKEVGLQGVSIGSLRDMQILTEGIRLDQISLVMQSQAFSSPVMLAFYVALVERQGLELAPLRVTIINDPLLSYWCGGLVDKVDTLDLGVKLAVDVVEYCTRHLPRAYCLYVDSYNHRELGMTAIDEAGWCFAKAKYYVDRVLERGLGVDEFAPRITFFCSAHIDFFEEIAKLRAMRRMWARLMREHYGAQNPRSLQFRFAVETAGSSLTQQQPINNIIRITTEALSAVLAGAQAVTPACYDEGICLPSEEAATVSIRTQQILAYETGVTNVADPLGGSYYVEHLTDRMEQEINKALARIEERGGVLETMKSGWFDQQWEASAYEYAQRMERGERIVVGVNAFTTEEEDSTFSTFRPSAHSITDHVEAVKRFKAGRDQAKLRDALAQLRGKAECHDVNLIPAMVEAAKSDATREEIIGVIREAYGLSYDPFGLRESPLPPRRG